MSVSESVDSPISPSLASRLRAAEETLTASDRAIAALLVADPVLLSYLSVERIARRVGVSKAAVVRFATRLGYGGFGELREDLQRRLHDRAGRPGPQPPAPAPSQVGGGVGGVRAMLAFRLAQDVAAISRLVELIDEDGLVASVDLLSHPEAGVHVVGQRRAHALALYTYRQLCWLRDDVRFFHPEELGLQVALHAIRPGDVVFMIAFRRHARVSQLVLKHALRVGAKTVLVTDAGCPFVHLADHALVCPVSEGSPFDSAVPAIFAVEALLALMIERIGQADVVAHVRQIQGYQEAVELESVDAPSSVRGRKASRRQDGGTVHDDLARLSPGMFG